MFHLCYNKNKFAKGSIELKRSDLTNNMMSLRKRLDLAQSANSSESRMRISISIMRPYTTTTMPMLWLTMKSAI